MARPLLLDLFCGAGGAGVGYWRAGFDVVGVDLEPQPHYPFRFIQADALTFDASGYDAIHASPVCKRYSSLRQLHQEVDYPDQIAIVRAKLDKSGVPWILENVETAPLYDALLICGTSLGLDVRRHRLFESPYELKSPGGCAHLPSDVNVYGHGAWNYVRRDPACGWQRSNASQSPVTKAQAAQALGIDWMNRNELAQAIPPAYTEWIGRQLVKVV